MGTLQFLLHTKFKRHRFNRKATFCYPTKGFAAPAEGSRDNGVKRAHPSTPLSPSHLSRPDLCFLLCRKRSFICSTHWKAKHCVGQRYKAGVRDWQPNLILSEFGSLNRSTEVRVNAFEEGDIKITFRALKQIYWMQPTKKALCSCTFSL